MCGCPFVRFFRQRVQCFDGEKIYPLFFPLYFFLLFSVRSTIPTVTILSSFTTVPGWTESISSSLYITCCATRGAWCRLFRLFRLSYNFLRTYKSCDSRILPSILPLFLEREKETSTSPRYEGNTDNRWRSSGIGGIGLRTSHAGEETSGSTRSIIRYRHPPIVSPAPLKG